MRKLTFLLTCIFLAGVLMVNAQTTKITGKVISADDEQPVVGATVLVKETKKGTITSTDGTFTITIDEKSKILVVSFIGMKKVEIQAKPNMVIRLEKGSTELNEVMVTAYGTAKKSTFTGSASNLSGDKISQKSTSEVSKSLAGEVAGVQVYNTNGQPGSNATIRIRGLGSVNSSNAPLYVIDGIPYYGELSSIDPDDVESTTILKDATAAALYGARASNGVVLITTKKGEKGETKVEVDVKTGFNTRLTPLYSTISSPERFVELTWEGLKNQYLYIGGEVEQNAIYGANADLFSENGIDPTYNIWKADGDKLIDGSTGKFYTGISRKYTPEKWSDYIFRTGQKTDASLKISGGSDKTKYFTSFGYLKDEGYYIESDFRRFNVRNTVSSDLTKWLKSNANLAYSYISHNAPGQTDSQNNGFQFVNFMPPLYSVFQRDENGNKVVDDVLGGYKYDYGMTEGNGRSYAAGINPAGAVKLDKYETVNHEFTGSTMFEARFLKDFKATVNIGIQYDGANINDLTNPYYGDAEGLGRITKTSFNLLSLSSNQLLSWNKKFNVHNFDAFLGHETQSYRISTMTGEKSYLVRPDNTEWSNAIIMSSMNSQTDEFSMESYFGQIRYDYDEKYMLTFNLRSDGTSRFSDNHKWGTFGSLGAAWLLNKENFLKDVSWLKSLKYKASYGILGNQDLIFSSATANFLAYETLYSIGNNNNHFSFTESYVGNTDLTWEKSKMFNTGFDFNISDRLDGSIEYFNKRTTDMLFFSLVAPSIRLAKYPINGGIMTNQGLELTLNYAAIKTKDTKLNIKFNAAHYTNKMNKMYIERGTTSPKPIEIDGVYGISKGYSQYDFYLREYAGVDPQTGLALYNQYFNVKKDGTREAITDMVVYEQNNKIDKLEVEKTSDYDDATKKYVDKSAIPTISGGFGVDFSWKGIEVNTTFTYSLGGYAYDGVYQTLMGDNTPGSNNWSTDIEKRWQKAGDVTDVPRLTSGYDSFTNATSTRFLVSRSYLNFNNARVAYNFPKKLMEKIKISKLSLYVTGENIFLISARKGFVSMSSVSGSSDRSRYLPVTTFMGGIKIEL